MLNAAVVGLGWWGGVLVNSVQGGQDRKPSDKIRFVKGVARDLAKYKGFAEKTGLPLADNLAEVLTAIGLILTAIGGLFYYKVVKEPPKPVLRMLMSCE